MAQSLSLAGAVVPSVLALGLLRWHRACYFSGVRTNTSLLRIISQGSLQLCFLSRASSQPSEPFFWLLGDPTTHVQGNMINGFIRQPSVFSLG